MDNEKEFYKNSNVLVTQSRVVINQKTYAMRNVSSVSMLIEDKSRSKLISVIFLVFGLILLYNSRYDLASVSIIIATIFLFNLKNKYIVRISSNSGDSNALISTDKNYIRNVVDAINKAIVYRG